MCADDSPDAADPQPQMTRQYRAAVCEDIMMPHSGMSSLFTVTRHAAARRVFTEVAQAAQRRICGVSTPRSGVSSLLTRRHGGLGPRLASGVACRRRPPGPLASGPASASCPGPRFKFPRRRPPPRLVPGHWHWHCCSRPGSSCQRPPGPGARRTVPPGGRAGAGLRLV
jgi:hypothetical protein